MPSGDIDNKKNNKKKNEIKMRNFMKIWKDCAKIEENKWAPREKTVPTS